ncbi:MAG: protein-L-isoaspartate O-methyltransferase [Silicimonas sp.]|nr:protein-L-isoaspartate O-methyltransferase [Silicimonas sp.]
MTDFARRRTTMVDTQVRPSDVTKFPIIDAMLNVAREDFVPVDKRDAAYADAHIDLGGGRVVLDPRTMAKMLEAADIHADEMVLDVGAGLGYSSALAGRLGEAVIALEEDEDRAAAAGNLLAEAGIDNAAAVQGTLTEGAAKHGPYDVIMIQGAVEHIPDALTSQLKDGGRIVAIFAEGALGSVRVGYMIDGEVSWRFAFNAGAPVIPGFEARRAFTL